MVTNIYSRPEQTALSNGIPVILQDYEGSVAATYWWVRTGSADERPDEAGFAHFLEHMLFKDAAAKETGRPSTGLMAKAIESLGGDINAYTSFDQTVYHVTCAEQHWEKVLRAFGALAKPQKFLKDDFEREREVILEELRKNEDSPERQLFQTLFSTTYHKHPYGRPVIGFAKILKAATVKHLEAFYDRNYVAGNMGLVLVGPIGQRRKELLALLDKHFGDRLFPKREVHRIARPRDGDLEKKPKLIKKSFDVVSPSLAFSFRAPELRHPDIPALDLVAGILSLGELSRLYQRLFYKTSLVTDISGGLYVPSDPGMLYFQAETADISKLDAVVEAILDELRLLKENGPSSDELARMIVHAESERLYATQTVDGLASRLGFLRFVLGDLDFDRHYLEELKKVDARRLRDVASKYLDSRRMSAVVLLPKQGHSLDQTWTGSKIGSKIETILKSAPVAAVALTIHKPKRQSESLLITRPSGLRIAYRERALSHVVSLHASVLGGIRLELSDPIERSETVWGSSNMMALTWTKGSQNKDAREIASIVEGHAASMDGFSGRNAVGLELTGLARDLPVLSDLFTEVLIRPSFADDEIAHSRRVAEDSIRAVEDHSSQLCSKLFLETLFDTHPYGKFTAGSLESIPLITGEKLKRFHRTWVRPERLVISVVGALDQSTLYEWIERLEASLSDTLKQSGQLASQSHLPEKIPNETPLKAPRWVERKLKREQIHIVVGGFGTTVKSPDRFALKLLQTLLAGQSGRLFVELREKKSLAYSVAPIGFEGIEKGYVGTYIGCGPEKRDEAIAGIKHVLESIANKGPNEAEMKRAKEFFLGRRAMDLQSDSAMAAHYGLQALYGLEPIDDSRLSERIRAVSINDIRKVCSKYFTSPAMVTSVVG